MSNILGYNLEWQLNDHTGASSEEVFNYLRNKQKI